MEFLSPKLRPSSTSSFKNTNCGMATQYIFRKRKFIAPDFEIYETLDHRLYLVKQGYAKGTLSIFSLPYSPHQFHLSSYQRL